MLNKLISAVLYSASGSYVATVENIFPVKVDSAGNWDYGDDVPSQIHHDGKTYHHDTTYDVNGYIAHH